MRLVLLILFFFCTLCSIGQKNFSISFTTDEYKKVKKNIQLNFKDSVSAISYARELRILAIKKGHLLASFDSYAYANKHFEFHFFIGDKIPYIQLDLEEKDKYFIRKSSKISEKFLSKTPFQPNELAKTLKLIHETALSNGYPFARVYLTDVSFNQNIPKATLKIDQGQNYTFTKIHIRGDSSISEILINSLIDIKPEDQYDESKLKNISSRIAQVPYLKEIKKHELLFTKEGVEIYLYLESVPVSSASGIVGLQPRVDGKMGVTGELNVKLLNVLSRGELINFSWKSIQEQTQALNSRINFPFLFKTPFGTDASFQLFKRDSTFLELKSTIGINYYLRGGNYLKAYYQNYQSGLLGGADNNPSFSNLSSVTTNSYGLSLFRRIVDYVPNPRKGFALLMDISTGTRTSVINDTLPEVKSTTLRGSFMIEWFYPLTNRLIFHFTGSTESYYAPEYFQNEVYRFGGQTTLRGFNEEELFATTKSIASLEFRYLLDKNSHLFVFYDQGFYENRSAAYINDTPFGFGTGLAFGTNLGIFSLSYALGKQQNNPILLQNGKIHFGYIAYF